MTKNFDNLNDAFNTSGEVINPEVQSPDEKIEKIKANVDDIKKDYDYTRGNLYSIIEKGQEAKTSDIPSKNHNFPEMDSEITHSRTTAQKWTQK